MMDTDNAISILAGSFYRELCLHGFTGSGIVCLSSELLSLVERDLLHHEDACKAKAG